MQPKQMLQCLRTTSDNRDFLTLIKELDADLKIRDGDEHVFYAQYNKLDKIKHVILAYNNEEPAGCGAIKEYTEDTMEIKRMFIAPDQRGQGFASIILEELEQWAKELKFKRCILETGLKQPEAIALYKKNDYKIIPNYGQYINMENSLCFAKDLR